MHDPEVIILDEPTIGLDPKQIIEVRHLIKGLAGSHTIILSTHILPEVSMTCDRVVIINKGKIAAVDTPENLTTQVKGGQRVHFEAQADESRAARSDSANTRRAASGRGARRRRPGRFAVSVESAAGHDVRSQIAAKLWARAGRYLNCAG